MVAIDTRPSTDVPAAAPASPSRARRAVRFLIRRPGLVLSILFVAAVLLAAFVPSLFTSRDPLVGVPAEKLQAPSAEHLFGTDQTGRDLFARVIHGANLSLRATVIAVAVALVVGSLIGLLAGFVGGWLDDIAMRIVDVLLAIPQLLLTLALVTVLGFGTTNVAIAVGLSTVANFARLMRAEVLRVRTATYVEAARATGARWYSILRRHVLPNAMGPIGAYAALDFGLAILAVSTLSFLGFGAEPPTPEWGSLVSTGRDYLATAWWLTTLPGLTVAATVLATNRISRALGGGGEEYR
ncbi:ABC transporter permease [Cryptosporangium aurantiacum]|uniref:Peptide/nickel transport system permease protein n=1 Tax=Cryptosporangium aurantiacum TaxID=134849 RepID=A0A1M7QB19_9ACTN|nr:ABC transporter permease [Cryptosporangium aurantiacum]SHN27839.1 peptide/nickel transport system permease protein [Cryptosporangium aurantiacum]